MEELYRKYNRNGKRWSWPRWLGLSLEYTAEGGALPREANQRTVALQHPGKCSQSQGKRAFQG
jgi:hypothetical protein